ncbi:helix-turn-helix transcriptional regulator [Kitasatospora kifunensis]|uniref:DNA-binding NarL/FixJ family response regulator n=1 Tax=Kitasatospora kifunensis TaxID=58351 RepID=A0A7W7QYR9_KITKI|nr:response regulator transcription factor [Kitasatospora kifunensis]MBB4921596.1 DNA-binding NarL/FixJ family response regulator [Kitasatospora kifunensis]
MPALAVLTRAADPISRAGLDSYLRAAPGVTLVEDRPADRRCTVVQLAESISDELLCEARSLAFDPRIRQVLIVARIQKNELFDVAASGISHLLLRHEVTPARLLQAVHGAHSGSSSLPPGLLTQLLDQITRLQQGVEAAQACDQPLDERELAVLRLVAEGRDTAEISAALGYSERWVKSVLYRLTNRLNLRNRTHAVAYALRQGLL